MVLTSLLSWHLLQLGLHTHSFTQRSLKDLFLQGLQSCSLSPGLSCFLKPWHKQDSTNPQDLASTLTTLSSTARYADHSWVSFWMLILTKHCHIGSCSWDAGTPSVFSLLLSQEFRYKQPGALGPPYCHIATERASPPTLLLSPYLLQLLSQNQPECLSVLRFPVNFSRLSIKFNFTHILRTWAEWNQTLPNYHTSDPGSWQSPCSPPKPQAVGLCCLCLPQQSCLPRSH